MQHLQTGPKHAEQAARLAHQGLDGDWGDHEDRMRNLAAAQVHALLAQTLVFAALVAADATEPELADPWLEVLDPDGTVRVEMAKRNEEARTRREELITRGTRVSTGYGES